MNHEYSEHVMIVHADELMPLLDAALEHNEKSFDLSKTNTKT